jgi:hypothetical protein
MTNPDTCAAWGLTVSAVLLCPIIVILSIPLMIGIGLDFFEVLGEVPFALVLCAPLALFLVRLFSPQPLAREVAAPMQARAPLRRSSELNYSESIS